MIKRIKSEINERRDWLYETWSDGNRTVETIIPPQYGQAPDYGKRYNTTNSRKMAERMLSRPQDESCLCPCHAGEVQMSCVNCVPGDCPEL